MTRGYNIFTNINYYLLYNIRWAGIVQRGPLNSTKIPMKSCNDVKEALEENGRLWKARGLLLQMISVNADESIMSEDWGLTFCVEMWTKTELYSHSPPVWYWPSYKLSSPLLFEVCEVWGLWSTGTQPCTFVLVISHSSGLQVDWKRFLHWFTQLKYLTYITSLTVQRTQWAIIIANQEQPTHKPLGIQMAPNRHRLLALQWSQHTYITMFIIAKSQENIVWEVISMLSMMLKKATMFSSLSQSHAICITFTEPFLEIQELVVRGCIPTLAELSLYHLHWGMC